jgi:hypothetical protein
MPKTGVKKKKTNTVSKKVQKKPRAVTTVSNSAPSGVFGNIGRGLGNIFGVGKYGGAAGELMDKVFGSGSYTVNSNSLAGPLSGPPAFRPSVEGVRISHREYIRDVTSSSSAFLNLIQCRINPGNTALFPWLSGVAANFEEYEIHGMIMEFKHTAGSAISSTNNALGKVVLATNYDVSDALYTNFLEAENYQYSSAGTVDCDIIHPIECKPANTILNTGRLIKYGSLTTVGAVADNLTDYGLFQLMVGGQQANAINIGELWCSYDITLRKQRLAFAGGGSIQNAHVRITPTTNNIWGATSNAFVVMPGSTFSPIWVGSNVMQPNVTGRFMFTYVITAATSAAWGGGTQTWQITSGPGSIVTGRFSNGVNNQAQAGDTQTVTIAIAIIDCNAQNPSLATTLSINGNSVTITGAASADLYITPINTNLTNKLSDSEILENRVKYLEDLFSSSGFIDGSEAETKVPNSPVVPQPQQTHRRSFF